MKKLTTELIEKRQNPSLLTYTNMYADIEKGTMKQIEPFGLPFEKKIDLEGKEKREQQLKDSGAIFRNNDKSILSNKRISSACEACQTGSGSFTSFVSMKCHRDCYFCFNKNQDNYEFYLENKKNANEELETMLNSGVKLNHLALTGGEPLLHSDDAISFFQLANRLAPDIHTRLYTAGDLLTVEILQGLREANLNEIRFSIKMEDSLSKRKHILDKITLAKQYIHDVMVEMPVIPGTDEEMKTLLLELDKLDIFGINLLEFCFPLENAQVFKDEELSLKNPPYDMYYNFWYAGGLAVAESEKLCHELVAFAMEQDLKLGVHYCSLENKFTGQIYQQNHDQSLGKTYSMSATDYYFKTTKVFGKDKRTVKRVLERKGISFIEDKHYDFLQFSIEAIPLLKHKDVDLIISSNVVEVERGETNIREVHLDWITPNEFVQDKIEI